VSVVDKPDGGKLIINDGKSTPITSPSDEDYVLTEQDKANLAYADSLRPDCEEENLKAVIVNSKLAAKMDLDKPTSIPLNKINMLDDNGRPTEEGLASILNVTYNKCLGDAWIVESYAVEEKDVKRFRELMDELGELGCNTYER